MKIAFQNENVTLWHGDCREWSGKADAVVSDPPYGMGYKPQNWKKWDGSPQDWTPLAGDDKPFDPSPWLCFPSVVLWGASYYLNRLPIGTVLVWDKRCHENGDKMFGASIEIGWTSAGKGGAEIKRLLHGGVVNADSSKGNNETRLHPTQKPIGLMVWCMDRAKVAPGATVLDPYAGSGTTLIAALETGRKAIGIEIDERWVEVACRRLERWHAQGRLDFGTANKGFCDKKPPS